MPKKKITAGKSASRTLKSKDSKSVAGSALTQRASQVKSSARTGKISRRIAHSVVVNISKKGNSK